MGGECDGGHDGVAVLSVVVAEAWRGNQPTHVALHVAAYCCKSPSRATRETFIVCGPSVLHLGLSQCFSLILFHSMRERAWFACALAPRSRDPSDNRIQ